MDENTSNVVEPELVLDKSEPDVVEEKKEEVVEGTIESKPSFIEERLKKYGSHPKVSAKHINTIVSAGLYDFETIKNIIAVCNDMIVNTIDKDDPESKAMYNSAIDTVIEIIQTCEQFEENMNEIAPEVKTLFTDHFYKALDSFIEKNKEFIPVDEAKKYPVSHYFLNLVLKRWNDPKFLKNQDKSFVVSYDTIRRGLRYMNEIIQGHAVGYVYQQVDMQKYKVISGFGGVLPYFHKLHVGLTPEDLNKGQFMASLHKKCAKYFKDPELDIHEGYTSFGNLGIHDFDTIEDQQNFDMTCGDLLKRFSSIRVNAQNVILEYEKKNEAENIPPNYLNIKSLSSIHNFYYLNSFLQAIIEDSFKSEIAAGDTQVVSFEVFTKMFRHFLSFIAYPILHEFLIKELEEYVKDNNFPAEFLGALENFAINMIGDSMHFALNFKPDEESKNPEKDIIEFFTRGGVFDIKQVNPKRLIEVDLDKCWKDFTVNYRDFLVNQTELIDNVLEKNQINTKILGSQSKNKKRNVRKKLNK